MTHVRALTEAEREELTTTAHDILLDDLVSYGNVLSEPHTDALRALVQLMTAQATGELRGRYCFDLQTGAGKTSAIVAWVAALYRLGHDHVSVAVSAAKVEALCELKRALIAHGVPAGWVGLLHSYRHDARHLKVTKEGYASEPATHDNDDRRIMLVTHARVRGGERSLARYATYKGAARSLLVYDESLLVSESVGVSFAEVKAAVAWLQALRPDDEALAHALSYASGCCEFIGKILASASGTHDVPRTPLRLPSCAPERLAEYRRAVNIHSVAQPLVTLLDFSQQPVRITKVGGQGTIWYQVAVPAELENILVLDASWPVRYLTQIDSTIKSADTVPFVKALAVPHDKIKRWDRVTVRQMKAGGGRSTLEKDWNTDDKRSVGKSCRDIVKVVRGVPEDESVLIFVYKAGRLNFEGRLRAALEHVGVDTLATVEFNGETRHRINIATWGNETSLNEWSHCRHVVLVGVLERQTIDLSANLCGQQDALDADITRDELRRVQNGEAAHLVYQAASRGAARQMLDGQASPMTLWMITRRNIRKRLDHAMPGASWEWWHGEYNAKAPKRGKIADLGAAIAEYLATVDTNRISLQAIWKTLNLSDEPATTRTHAVQHFLDTYGGWTRDGRSLRTLASLFPV